MILRAGRDAIGVEDVVADPKTSKARESQHQPNQSLPRTGSKQALVVAMLSRKNGATIDELTAATGWLPHTTRAALTGLRKRGHTIERHRTDDVSHYRIVATKEISRATMGGAGDASRLVGEPL